MDRDSVRLRTGWITWLNTYALGLQFNPHTRYPTFPYHYIHTYVATFLVVVDVTVVRFTTVLYRLDLHTFDYVVFRLVVVPRSPTTLLPRAFPLLHYTLRLIATGLLFTFYTL